MSTTKIVCMPSINSIHPHLKDVTIVFVNIFCKIFFICNLKKRFDVKQK
jgi:hypothetical protein